MFDFIKNLKQMRLDRLQMEGFDYGAGQLLRGYPAEYLEAECSSAFSDNEDMAFNEGVLNAIKAFNRIKFISEEGE